MPASAEHARNDSTSSFAHSCAQDDQDSRHASSTTNTSPGSCFSGEFTFDATNYLKAANPTEQSSRGTNEPRSLSVSKPMSFHTGPSLLDDLADRKRSAEMDVDHAATLQAAYASVKTDGKTAPSTSFDITSPSKNAALTKKAACQDFAPELDRRGPSLPENRVAEPMRMYDRMTAQLPLGLQHELSKLAPHADLQSKQYILRQPQWNGDATYGKSSSYDIGHDPISTFVHDYLASKYGSKWKVTLLRQLLFGPKRGPRSRPIPGLGAVMKHLPGIDFTYLSDDVKNIEFGPDEVGMLTPSWRSSEQSSPAKSYMSPQWAHPAPAQSYMSPRWVQPLPAPPYMSPQRAQPLPAPSLSYNHARTGSVDSNNAPSSSSSKHASPARLKPPPLRTQLSRPGKENLADWEARRPQRLSAVTERSEPPSAYNSVNFPRFNAIRLRPSDQEEPPVWRLPSPQKPTPKQQKAFSDALADKLQNVFDERADNVSNDMTSDSFKRTPTDDYDAAAAPPRLAARESPFTQQAQTPPKKNPKPYKPTGEFSFGSFNKAYQLPTAKASTKLSSPRRERTPKRSRQSSPAKSLMSSPTKSRDGSSKKPPPVERNLTETPDAEAADPLPLALSYARQPPSMEQDLPQAPEAEPADPPPLTFSYARQPLLVEQDVAKDPEAEVAGPLADTPRHERRSSSETKAYLSSLAESARLRKESPQKPAKPRATRDATIPRTSEASHEQNVIIAPPPSPTPSRKQRWNHFLDGLGEIMPKPIFGSEESSRSSVQGVSDPSTSTDTDSTVDL